MRPGQFEQWGPTRHPGVADHEIRPFGGEVALFMSPEDEANRQPGQGLDRPGQRLWGPKVGNGDRGSFSGQVAGDTQTAVPGAKADESDTFVLEASHGTRPLKLYERHGHADQS